MLQVLSDLNPATTITSIDGVGAFDLISRKAMLKELRKVPGGAEVMPFVLMEDDCGVAHPTLVAAQSKLMAFLDDVYIVSPEPDLVENGHAVVHELFHHAKIQINKGKTKVWNRAGVRPQVCNILEQMASPTPAHECGEDRTGQTTNWV